MQKIQEAHTRAPSSSSEDAMHNIKCYMFVVFGYDKLVSKAQTHADTAKTLPYFKRKKTQIVFLDIQSSGFRFGQIFKI